MAWCAPWSNIHWATSTNSETARNDMVPVCAVSLPSAIDGWEVVDGTVDWEMLASTGTVEETEWIVEVVDYCIAGPPPPAMIVAQPHFHSNETRVEIWGVADATCGRQTEKRQSPIRRA